MSGRVSSFRAMSYATLLLWSATGALAQQSASTTAASATAWQIGKSSGDVWVMQQGVQKAALAPQQSLKPGDTVRTGRNGRALLTRGAETILIAPNSVVGIPAEAKNGLQTTITQQAGSILLEVEKRDVQHFEVETPYLAAVVKGTRFEVTVNGAGTRVSVQRGQVEVQDFKSGQIAQVMPGQAAQTFAAGKPGLSLSGAGALRPIEHGKPRAPTIDRVTVPKGGFAAPRDPAKGQQAARAASEPMQAAARGQQQHGPSAAHRGARISSALGEVKLNVQKVTNGLARGHAGAADRGRRTSARDTIWGSGETRASAGNDGSSSTNGGATTSAASAAAAASVSAGSMGFNFSGTSNANASSSSNNGNGNGNGNANANGNGNGNTNANGNGNANNGNGNGNNGNGNGNSNNHGDGNNGSHGNGNRGRGRG